MKTREWRDSTYKVCQMHMALRIQKNIVRLDISVYNTLLMYVSQRTSQFSDPEADSFFGEGLSLNMESEVAAVHQVHHNVPTY
jgi:hypothetical protein